MELAVVYCQDLNGKLSSRGRWHCLAGCQVFHGALPSRLHSTKCVESSRLCIQRWGRGRVCVGETFHFSYSMNIIRPPQSSVQFSSVAQSCLTLCDPMNHSTPGLPVHHQLPEFTQTDVHRVSDAIQPSHPLSSPSPPAPNPSQHQSLFQ